MANQIADTATHVPAQLTLFGFAPTPADVEVIARPRSWRITHALLALGISWALIPVVLLVPPHIPWVIGAFGAGIYLGQKRLRERYTLASFDGTCPKCGKKQETKSGVSLKVPYPITCRGCMDELMLEVEIDALRRDEGASPPVPPTGSAGTDS